MQNEIRNITFEDIGNTGVKDPNLFKEQGEFLNKLINSIIPHHLINNNDIDVFDDTRDFNFFQSFYLNLDKKIYKKNKLNKYLLPTIYDIKKAFPFNFKFSFDPVVKIENEKIFNKKRKVNKKKSGIIHFFPFGGRKFKAVDFIENSSKLLKDNGFLIFILPNYFVVKREKIREKLAKNKVFINAAINLPNNFYKFIPIVKCIFKTCYICIDYFFRIRCIIESSTIYFLFNS